MTYTPVTKKDLIGATVTVVRCSKGTVVPVYHCAVNDKGEKMLLFRGQFISSGHSKL